MEKDKYGNFVVMVGSNPIAIPQNAVQDMLGRISRGEVTPQQGSQQIAQQYGGANFGTRPDLISGITPMLIPQGTVTVGGRTGYFTPQGNFIPTTTQVNSTVVNGGGPTSTVSQTSSFPTTNLQPGSTGSEVQKLQEFLVSQGFMSQADMNTGPGTYGPKTTAAVQAWQQAKGVNNSSGPGYWGPQSIATAKTITTSNPNPPPASGGSGSPAGGSSSNFSAIESSDPFLVDYLKDPANKAMYDSLPDFFKGLFLSNVSRLTKAVEAGQVVNPNIDITPEKAKEFLDQATTELDPYYKEQIGNLKTDFQTSIDRLMQDYNKGVTRASDTLKTNLQDQSNNEADAGTVYSSGRVDRQNRTLTLANNAVEDSATAASRAAQDNATTLGRQLGPMAFNGMNVPNLPTFSAGENGFTQSGNRSLYAPVGDSAIGSIPASEKTAVAGRASQLESAYRSGRNLDLSTLS